MHYWKKKTGKKRTWMWGDFLRQKKERKTCSGQSTLSHCMMSMMKAVSRFWHEYQLKVAALVLLSSVKTTKYFLFNKNALGLKGSLSILRAFWRRQHGRGRKTKNQKNNKPKQPVCCLRRPPWRDWCHHSLALCYLAGSWWVLFIYLHFCTHTWLLAVS